MIEAKISLVVLGVEGLCSWSPVLAEAPHVLNELRWAYETWPFKKDSKNDKDERNARYIPLLGVWMVLTARF